MRTSALNGTADDDEYNAKNRKQNELSRWLGLGKNWMSANLTSPPPSDHLFRTCNSANRTYETIGCLSLESYSFLETLMVIVLLDVVLVLCAFTQLLILSGQQNDLSDLREFRC